MFLTHFFNLHELMAIVVIVDTLDADLDGTGFAKVLNHLMRMPWTGDALKISKEQWHSLFTINEIKNFLIFPALLCRPFHYGFVVVGALSQPLILEHVLDTGLAKCAPALMKD